MTSIISCSASAAAQLGISGVIAQLPTHTTARGGFHARVSVSCLRASASQAASSEPTGDNRNKAHSSGLPSAGAEPLWSQRRSEDRAEGDRWLDELQAAAVPIGHDEKGRPIYRRAHAGYVIEPPEDEYWTSGRRGQALADAWRGEEECDTTLAGARGRAAAAGELVPANHLTGPALWSLPATERVLLDTNAVIKFAFEEVDNDSTGVTSIPMSKETTAWLEGLQLVLVPLPVFGEIDILNRISKKYRIAFKNKTGQPVEGNNLVAFLNNEARLEVLENMSAMDVVEIGELWSKATEPGHGGEDLTYFDVAVPYLAGRDGYRLITCDSRLQAAPEVKTGW